MRARTCAKVGESEGETTQWQFLNGTRKTKPSEKDNVWGCSAQNEVLTKRLVLWLNSFAVVVVVVVVVCLFVGYCRVICCFVSVFFLSLCVC